MENAPVHCILCGKTERTLLIEKDSWSVYRCMSCGLGVLDPRPTRKELKLLYDQKYCDNRLMEGGTPGSRQFKKRLGLETHRIKFFRRMKRSGKILDIGCGYGYFLAACREAGYDVHGLDFSESAVTHARTKLDLPLTVGAPAEVNLPEQAFDVITLWHALEHMPDPQETILKARTWLKPDGILAVDVPNYLGTDARKQGVNWNGWDLPYHYYHFTPQTLNRFLGKFDFRVAKQKDYHSQVVKEALKQIPLLSLFARPLSKFYSGHSIAVIARLEK